MAQEWQDEGAHEIEQAFANITLNNRPPALSASSISLGSNSEHLNASLPQSPIGTNSVWGLGLPPRSNSMHSKPPTTSPLLRDRSLSADTLLQQQQSTLRKSQLLTTPTPTHSRTLSANLAQQPLPVRTHSGGYTYNVSQLNYPPPQPQPPYYHYQLNYPIAVMASESDFVNQVAGLNSISRDWIYVVKFKRTQRSFILARGFIGDVKVGHYVKVEADRGEDLGLVISKNANNYENSSKFKNILRLASVGEVHALSEKKQEEAILLKICRKKVLERKLPMLILDAEYQFDRHKLTFFFEAETRVDFRELVRDLFSIYKTRIWMQHLDSNRAKLAPVPPYYQEPVP